MTRQQAVATDAAPATLAPGGAPNGERWPVAVLGATGAVGQTFVRLLDGHPWFEVTELAASERSAGRTYADATRWLEGEMPRALRDRVVLPCDPAAVTAPIVFSALDSAAAESVEPAFAAAGRLVLSNAKSYRMAPDVPLLIPEVNWGQAGLLRTQAARRGWPETGALVTNANCSATVIAMALAPLHAAFGVERVFVATMQAVSGAGYPGVPSLDILGNVVPYIADEEPKIEAELRKLLGTIDAGMARDHDVRVAAHANRVAVEHGHTACLSVGFARRATPADVVDALGHWRGPDALGPWLARCPSAPASPIVVTDASDRPQPRRDRDVGRGHERHRRPRARRPDPRRPFRRDGPQHDSRRGRWLRAQRGAARVRRTAVRRSSRSLPALTALLPNVRR